MTNPTAGRSFTASQIPDTFSGSWGAPGGLIVRISDDRGVPIADASFEFDLADDQETADENGNPTYTGMTRFHVREHADNGYGVTDFMLLAELMQLIQDNQWGDFYSSAFERPETEGDDLDISAIDRALPFPNKLGGIW
jgi:hypothetical protein